MTDTERVTPKILHKLLRYEPETGKLFWRERSDELSKNPSIRKSWNARYAGCPSPPHHKQRRRMMNPYEFALMFALAVVVVMIVLLWAAVLL